MIANMAKKQKKKTTISFAEILGRQKRIEHFVGDATRSVREGSWSRPGGSLKVGASLPEPKIIKIVKTDNRLRHFLHPLGYVVASPYDRPNRFGLPLPKINIITELSSAVYFNKIMDRFNRAVIVRLEENTNIQIKKNNG